MVETRRRRVPHETVITQRSTTETSTGLPQWRWTLVAVPLLTSESARCQWTRPCISCHFPERVQRRHSKPCKCPLMRCSCNCPPCTGQFSRQEAKLLFMSSSSQAESTVLRSRLPKWCYGRTSSLSSSLPGISSQDLPLGYTGYGPPS